MIVLQSRLLVLSKIRQFSQVIQRPQTLVVPLGRLFRPNTVNASEQCLDLRPLLVPVQV